MGRIAEGVGEFFREKNLTSESMQCRQESADCRAAIHE